MMCILQIVMLVFGIIILFSGRMKMSGKELEGVTARLLGLAMTLTLPVCLTIGILYGIAQAAAGKSPQEVQEEAFMGPLMFMDIGVTLGVGALVLIVFHMLARPVSTLPPVMPPLGPPKQTDNPYEPPANPFGDR